jgi:hypothetical protein
MSKQNVAPYGRALRLARFAVPGIVFATVFGFAACTGKGGPVDHNCPTDTGSGAGGSAGGSTGGTAGSGGATTGTTTTTSTTLDTGNGGSAGGVMGNNSGKSDNTFDHFNDPGDPFDILKQHAEEGPPEIRGRLHSCTKLPYSSLGAFLASRGVNMDAVAPAGKPKTAGQLYKEGKDSLGVANYDARQAEAYFHTTSGATKTFDIFVQAADEIIANVSSVPACQVGGVGKPMFDAKTGECVFESLSCIMGRPAKPADMKLCNTMIAHAAPGDQADLDIKRRITVAAFLSAAHTCE